MKKHHKTTAYGFSIHSLLALAMGALLGAGCAAVPHSRVTPPDSAVTNPAVAEINNTLASAALQTPTSSADYRLGPEDLLQITLFNMPESETVATPRRVEVRVSQGGMITLPLLGDISAAGLTVSALEQSLQSRYDEFLHNPLVGVQVKEYRSQLVSVMGAVRNPGVFQLTGPRTLVDLLSMAGGISKRAGSQVHIYRQSSEGRQSYVIDLLVLASNPGMVNMPIQAGNMINVPQAGMFFVDGAVGKPGSYPLPYPYTLTQALAAAGGITRTLADYGGIAIFRRRDGAEAEKIPVDLSAILAQRASDPPIAANDVIVDVIVVPISTAKYIVQRFIGTISLGSAPALIP
jgi:polysaccharide export outer membrane protein